ncbi:MAG TPA: response regulator [Methanomicrobiales archaeon]|jgi:PAS domain S-box-containing protein|nr:response regulator [Methanomicrobiales archaeon]
MKPRILVVEDEFVTAADIEGHLREMGFEVPATVDSGEGAIVKAGEIRPDLILMDITLSGRLTGIEAAERIRQLYGIPVIFLTAHSEQSTLRSALSSNPFGYIIKPFDPSGLRAGIEMALYKHGMEARLRENERTIRSLLDAIPDALVLLDAGMKVVAVNEGMARELGKDRNGLMGAPANEFLQAKVLGISPADLDILIREGTPAHRVEEQGGRWYETTMYPVRDDCGTIARIAIQSHDITDVKRVEEAMRKEGLDRIERNMEQFQILNDQIRNPLQVIKGYADLCSAPCRDRIGEQVGIINDLVTRLDQGWVESEKVRSFLMRHCRLWLPEHPAGEGWGEPTGTGTARGGGNR